MGEKCATSSTTMDVNQPKTIQFQYILMYDQLWIPSQHSGTEQERPGGAGLVKTVSHNIIIIYNDNNDIVVSLYQGSSHFFFFFFLNWEEPGYHEANNNACC